MSVLMICQPPRQIEGRWYLATICFQDAGSALARSVEFTEFVINVVCGLPNRGQVLEGNARAWTGLTYRNVENNRFIRGAQAKPAQGKWSAIGVGSSRPAARGCDELAHQLILRAGLDDSSPWRALLCCSTAARTPDFNAATLTARGKSDGASRV